MRARVAGLPLAVGLVAVAVGSASAPAAQLHSAAACTLNDVRIFYLGQQGAAGTFGEQFRLNKRGKGSCTIRGYAKVTLLGKQGKPVGIKVHNDHSQKVRTRTLAKGKRVSFRVLHPDPANISPSKCKARNVYRFEVTLPNAPKVLTLKGFDPIKFCQKGARVTPFAKQA